MKHTVKQIAKDAIMVLAIYAALAVVMTVHVVAEPITSIKGFEFGMRPEAFIENAKGSRARRL